MGIRRRVGRNLRGLRDERGLNQKEPAFDADDVDVQFTWSLCRDLLWRQRVILGSSVTSLRETEPELLAPIQSRMRVSCRTR